jgi:hypothetical protein
MYLLDHRYEICQHLLFYRQSKERISRGRGGAALALPWTRETMPRTGIAAPVPFGQTGTATGGCFLALSSSGRGFPAPK